MAAQHRVVLIEGLPGSGKTTLAQWLCEWLRARGVAASWVPEVRADHPVIDRVTMRTASRPGYGARCGARWRAFASSVARRAEPHVHILEGCFLQSRVRLLLEYDRSEDEAAEYLEAAEAALAPLSPRLVRLIQPDPETFLLEELPKRKDFEVLARIAAYTEGTPYGRAHGLRGAPGMVELYVRYGRLCDALLARSRIARLEVESATAAPTSVRQRVSAWLSA